ncbi:lmo0937 family membrane protein [Williamwhitmania taraxaci]|uniref:Lmo0937 family membrane protein n=1 Tax=Williamwhitmania taraxaci TaxID=1640674 RepID=A0A1G6QPK4_9BACT|nr:lmo0937 family membrane protein [Williamwhitmania taraxaci]SDC94268.1 hypothetical protein SAMN05216323_106411 [Williamwhitmania taraxaci]
MTNLLYVLAIVILIIWALGFFVFHLGAIIHLLLVLAIISVLIRVIRGKK